MPLSEKPINIFFSYSRKDQRLRDRLETQLSFLKRQGLISSWYDHNIEAGEDWSKKINSYLEAAQIVLLLISSNFIASDYCYGIEMKKAMEKHKAGQCRVIPIILRPVAWKDTPFCELQVLPANTKPVTSWRNLDEAFLDISNGICEVVKTLKMEKENDCIQEVRNKLDKSEEKVDILIVEDNKQSEEVLRVMLNLSGYNTYSSEDALEAMVHISKRQFDLILLDLGLPKINGTKIIEQLRMQKINTPIIIVSAAGNQEIVRGIKIGADGFVQKPFTYGELCTVIEGMLGNKTTIFKDSDSS